MWCCASKPQVKKVLKSAKQQPLSKVILNLPPTIQLEYKKQWQGKITQKQSIQKQGHQSFVQNNKQNKQNINELKQKIQQLQKMKQNLLKQFQSQQNKGKQLQQSMSKAEAIETVLNYMILKKQRQIDSFVMKIKT